MDAVPLDALFNGDDGECISINIGQQISDAIDNGGTPVPAPPVQVTLHDGDGTIVGTQTLPDRGGDFDTATGCTWTVEFDDVPLSKFYEADLSVDGSEWQGAAEGSAQTVVRIDL